MLWVVPFVQVFAESCNAYLYSMQGSVSNFADFQFWPYCPYINCSNFCSNPSLAMEGISNSALETSLSFNTKSMQKQLRRTNSKWRYLKKVTFYFLRYLVIFYQFVDPFAMGVRGHKGVETKPQYSCLYLIDKSNNKAPEKLVNAYAVSCNFYGGYCRIS